MVMYQHCEVLTSVQKTLHCENHNDLVGVLIYISISITLKNPDRHLVVIQMLVSFLNSLPPSLQIKCSPPPSSSDDPAWFLSTYLLGDAVFLHPEVSPTCWPWDNPVFVHQLVLRWPFPSILRWPCFPPRGPEMTLFSSTPRWPCFPPRGPEMTLFPSTLRWPCSPPQGPEMTLFPSTLRWSCFPPWGPEMTLFPSTLRWPCFLPPLVLRMLWHCFLPPSPCCFDSSEIALCHWVSLTLCWS